MRRLGPGLLAAALVLGVAGLLVLDPPPAPAARRAPDDARARRVAPGVPARVALFGDSLTYQARPELEERLPGATAGGGVLSTRPGAALCDDRAEIVRTLVTHRPEVLVLEYSGNSVTRCMRDGKGGLLTIGSKAWSSRYEADLRSIARVAATTGTRIVWVTAPPVRHARTPRDYPSRIAAVARRVAADHSLVRVANTGAALTRDDGGYTDSLPCKRDEVLLCVDGRIAVRADDRLHFDCHGSVDHLGGCIGYSAGGRRYAEAIVAAVSSSRSRRP